MTADPLARLRALDETLISPELYVRLVDALPDALVVIGEDGRVVIFNRQAELLWGYHRAEVIGRRLERLMPERFRMRHLQHRAQYGAEPHTRPMGADLKIVALTKTGEEVAVEIAIAPLQTPDGRFDAAIVRRVRAS